MHFPSLSHSGSVSRVFHKGAYLVGPVFCALPRSEQLRQQGAWRAHSPQVGGGSYHLPGPSPSVSWERCLRCAVCLLCGADLWLRPSWGISTVQDHRETWLATGSLLTVWWRMPSLWQRFPLAFQLWLLPACLSQRGLGRSAAAASSPLVFAQSFVLWAGWLCLRAFHGKVLSLSLSFFPSLWLSHSLSCYLTVAPSDYPQGTQPHSLP